MESITPSEANRTRIVVAHADPAARRRIRDLLASDPGFIVVATAGDGAEAIELAAYYRPELVLLAADLPRLDGLTACQVLRERVPGAAVAILLSSAGAGDDSALAAVRAGARGVLVETRDGAWITTALHAIAAGEAAISTAVAGQLVARLRETSELGVGMRPVQSPLTGREWEVLDLICVGMTTREIAGTLFLTHDTVYGHVKRLLRKLGVNSRAEAVRIAIAMRQPTAS
jgi:DNA-binding NarL/FixJ family response regulator